MPAQQPKQTRGVYEKIPGSGVWWIRFSDATTGKLRREKAGTISAAKQLYGIRKAASWQGHKLPHTIKGKAPTFSILAKDAEAYLLTQNRSGGDKDRIKLLSDLFGGIPAESIRPQDIEKRLNEVATKRKWKPATTNRHKAVLSLIFRLALNNGKVTSNPARLVRRLKEDNHVIRFLSIEEQKRLEAVLTPERWAMVQLALNTGARAGELWDLKWRHVDDASASPQITLLKTKNGSIRYVPLNADALDALRVLSKVEGTAGYVFPREPYRFWFESAIKAAKIESFRFHDLRHTFASRCTMQGVGPVALAALLGHRSLAMVLRYSHLAPKHLADAVSRLVSFGTSTKTDTASVGSS